jgi:hypothetical protein
MNLLEKRVSVSANDLALDKVLDQLCKQTGCYFTYNADKIDGNRKVTINQTNLTLRAALDSLLNNPNFTYQLVNNQVVIHPFVDANEAPDSSIKKQQIINGTVVDALTGEALPFASIVLKNSYFGGIANAQGQFSIKIPDSYFSDTLVFSYMGYYNKQLSINEILEELTVALDQGIVSIQEVIIRSVEPELLLKKARSLFRDNYYDKAYNYEAFYREAVKKSSRYMVYSEALINGYKPSFLHGQHANKVQLEKSRKFTNIQQTDTLMVKLRGGMETCFQLDIIHQMPDFLTEKGAELYNYSITDITTFQDELVYVIGFKQKDFIQEALFEGLIYISVNRHAIVGVDFWFSKEKLRKTSNFFVIKKIRQVANKPNNTAYKVQYAKLNGKYYTKHVRGELTFKVKKRRQIISENYVTLLEMVYTQIDTAMVKKPLRKDMIETNTIFSDTQYLYDSDFWQESNVISPEENILDAFKNSGFKLQEQGE